MKKKVVILRNDILPLSETFILEQMRLLNYWHPILVGRRLCENGLNLKNIDYRIIPKAKASLMQKISVRIRNLLGVEDKRTASYILSLNPDLIHVHFGTDAVGYWNSVKNLDIPILVTLHGYDINISKEWWQQGKGGHFMKKYPKRLVSLSKHNNVSFIAVSEAIKNKAIEFGIPASKIQVHYIGVDTNKFKPSGLPLSQRDNTVLFVGRFVEKKAPLQLIQAFSQVVKHVPDAKLVMVGDGVLKKEAECLAKALRLPVEFKGALKHEQVLKEYDKAKVFCLPSITAKNGDAEGLPIAILEAISKNLFIIVTSHSGNTDIPFLENIGLVINENSIEQIASSLTELLNRNSKVDIKDIGLFVEKFDLLRCSQKLEKIYSEVVI